MVWDHEQKAKNFLDSRRRFEIRSFPIFFGGGDFELTHDLPLLNRELDTCVISRILENLCCIHSGPYDHKRKQNIIFGPSLPEYRNRKGRLMVIHRRSIALLGTVFRPLEEAFPLSMI